MVSSAEVVVVGSLNLDCVLRVERPPNPGETVLGRQYTERLGGKGRNQAVAAAAVVSTAFVGAVGGDDAGRRLAADLADHGVDTTHLQISDAPTGRAVISVTDDAENRIVVILGANTTVGAREVETALDALEPAVVLTQLEVPMEAVDAAARWSRRNGRRFILNPSPSTQVEPEVLNIADPLVVNRNEGRSVVGDGGLDPEGLDNPKHLARDLLQYSRSALLTVGPEGAWAAEQGRVEHVPALPVVAVDTTGAGDAFAGTVAGFLAAGANIVDAAKAGVDAAAVVVSAPSP